MRAGDGASPESSVLGAPLLLALICSLGFALRLAALIRTCWLYDEIVYVDWLGHWFAVHTFQYLLQWQHILYPPRSPYFANPPLVPLIFGVAMRWLSPFGVPALISARIVSLIAGTLLLPLTYRLARLWYDRVGSLAATFFVATSPTLVVLSGTAYLESVALLLGTLAFYAFVKAGYARTTRMWVGTIVLVALALLAKATNVIVAGAIQIYYARLALARSAPPWMAVSFFPAAYLACAILWAGARDPHQIAGTLSYLFGERPASHLGPTYSRWEYPIYYWLMFIGSQSTFVLAALAFGSFLVIREAVSKGRATAGVYWIAATAAVLTGLPLLVGFSSRHELATAEECGALAFGAGFEMIGRVGARTVRVVALVVVPLATAVFFATPPAAWNSFNNILVGGARSESWYMSGDADGSDLVAAWLNAHSPPGTVVASPASHSLNKYLEGGRTAMPSLTSVTDADLRGVDYVALPAAYLHSIPTPLSLAARGMDEVASFPSDSQPYFVLFRRPTNFLPLSDLDGLFEFKAVRSTVSTVDATPPLRYAGTIGRYGWITFESPPVPFEGDAIVYRVKADANVFLAVDVISLDNRRYMRYLYPLRTRRWSSQYIRFQWMGTDPGDLNPADNGIRPAFFQHKMVRIRISVEAMTARPQKVDVALSDIGIADYGLDYSSSPLPPRFYFAAVGSTVVLHSDIVPLRYVGTIGRYGYVLFESSAIAFRGTGVAYRISTRSAVVCIVDVLSEDGRRYMRYDGGEVMSTGSPIPEYAGFQWMAKDPGDRNPADNGISAASFTAKKVRIRFIIQLPRAEPPAAAIDLRGPVLVSHLATPGPPQ